MISCSDNDDLTHLEHRIAYLEHFINCRTPIVVDQIAHKSIVDRINAVSFQIQALLDKNESMAKFIDICILFKKMSNRQTQMLKIWFRTRIKRQL